MITALLLGCIVFSSFRIDSNLLTGVWVPTAKNGQLEWRETIPKNRRCYIFKENGRLTVRQNVGWCGTPPVTYGNYSGTWKQTSDSTISMKYKYWGGQVDAVWKIRSLTEDEMIYKAETFHHRTSR